MGETTKEAYIARHADKGGWKINENELGQVLPADQAGMVLDILQSEFPQMKETPLSLDGLKRSLKFGEVVFEMLPDECVLVVMDSGKDRAQLTRSLAVNRIAQLEQEDSSGKEKRVDMLLVEDADLRALLKDSDDSTWPPYAEMIKIQGISESEAIFRWLNDMNKPGSGIDPKVAPAESARRYRELVQLMHKEGVGITSNKPVVLLGVGHSGSLGQVKYEEGGVERVSDTPQFCEMLQFDENAKLLNTKEVKI